MAGAAARLCGGAVGSPLALPPLPIPLVSLCQAYADLAALHAADQRLGLPGATLPAAKQVELRRGYYAAVSHVDEAIGTVLGALDASGLRRSTVVAVVADHGWQLGEHGVCRC